MSFKLNYLFLIIAIVTEVIATSALKSSEGLTRLFPSFIVIIGYGISFYCLSIVLQRIPIGIAYALWAGLGILLVWLVGVIFYKQAIDWGGLSGVILIISGVVMINLFSNVSMH